MIPDESLAASWIAIHRGSLSNVLVLRGELEANGIACDVPAATVGIVDPFVRGGNVLEYELCVLVQDAARAREAIEPRTPMELQPAEHGKHGSVPGFDEPVGSRVGDELAPLRLRIRRMWWSTITVFFAPYCLALAPGYFRDSSRSGLSASERWLTLAALALALALTVPLLWFLADTSITLFAPA